MFDRILLIFYNCPSMSYFISLYCICLTVVINNTSDSSNQFMNECIKFPANILFLFRKSNFMYGFILGFRHVPIKLASI